MNAAVAPAQRTQTVPAAVRNLLRASGLLVPIFRMMELRRALEFPRPPRIAPDGKPLPDRLRMVRIGNSADWRHFYEGGEKAAATLVDLARNAGADPSAWRTVLDWGCGCGRIARHITRLTPARLIGRDIDRYGVTWCKGRLEGDFDACSLSPPLDIADASIDFAYGYSVITHLTGDSQRIWLAEMGRVLRPGGLLALTFHDHDYLTADKVTVRRSDHGVRVTEWVQEGSNLVAAFQDIDSIRDAAAPFLDVVNYLPSRDSPFDQAVALLRRRP